MPADTFVIVNPASAGGRTGRRWPRIADDMAAAGIAIDVHFTRAPREATTRTREALAAGYTRVVAVGGDGTLNEVVNGYFNDAFEPVRAGAVLGLIPSGTGGDFRRTAGVIAADRAIAALSSGNISQIDAGRIEKPGVAPHWFINIADWGVGGDIVARVNRSRFKAGGARGSAVFLGISLRNVLTYGARRVRLTIDGHAEECDVSNVVVANGRYFGGGMHVAPRARIDDGLFDVVTVGKLTAAQTFANLPRLYRGTHIGRHGIQSRRGRVVTIEPLDGAVVQYEAEGEHLGAGGATVTCVAGAVRFAMP